MMSLSRLYRLHKNLLVAALKEKLGNPFLRNLVLSVSRFSSNILYDDAMLNTRKISVDIRLFLNDVGMQLLKL